MSFCWSFSSTILQCRNEKMGCVCKMAEGWRKCMVLRVQPWANNNRIIRRTKEAREYRLIVSRIMFATMRTCETHVVIRGINKRFMQQEKRRWEEGNINVYAADPQKEENVLPRISWCLIPLLCHAAILLSTSSHFSYRRFASGTIWRQPHR